MQGTDETKTDGSTTDAAERSQRRSSSNRASKTSFFHWDLYLWLDTLRSHRILRHPIVEVTLSWWIAVFCLVYYGISYAAVVLARRGTHRSIPLMTYNLEEESVTLASLHESKDPTVKDFIRRLSRIAGLGSTGGDADTVSEEELYLVKTIHTNYEIRRAVSNHYNSPSAEYTCVLDRLKDSIFKFPTEHSPYKFDIALIVPAYKENGRNIARILRHAHKIADNPSGIQVIIVNAGHSYNMDALKEVSSMWACFKVIEYTRGGGRGPTLNAGARDSTCSSRIYTFVHADTLLPHHWDRKILRTLKRSHLDTVVQACAFSFGHDLSQEGLGTELPFPWGISSVFMLGNLRAYFFSLPYGDHVISIPSSYFHFVGGFPNQPIMEDYELMDVLRRRAKLFTNESIQIIPPPTARCGVRRWQQHGVPYTTLVNFLIVYRYVRGNWSPREIFEYYYGDKKKDS